MDRQRLKTRVKTARVTLLIVGLLSVGIVSFLYYTWFKTFGFSFFNEFAVYIPLILGLGIIAMFFVSKTKPVIGLSLGLGIYVFGQLIDVVYSGGVALLLQGWLLKVIFIYLVARGNYCCSTTAGRKAGN